MSDFYSDCDIKLESAVKDLRDKMKEILTLIDECRASECSEYDTYSLETDICRFLEDH